MHNEPSQIIASTCIAVLAAGQASRMGSPKQLLEFDGEALVRRVAKAALRTQAAEVCVIVGSNAQDVARQVEDLPLDIVTNGIWRNGQSTSVKMAVNLASANDFEWLCIIPGDMPFLEPEHIHALAQAASRNEATIAASLSPEGTPMAPCLFHATHFEQLGKLSGDSGAIRLIMSINDTGDNGTIVLTPFDSPVQCLDVDTPEEYQQALCIMNQEVAL